jgi:bifunctional ADP-heptose synthase (sugar kinase/adenylyltransferase)
VANRYVEVMDQLIEMDHATPKTILVIGDGMTDVYVHGTVGTGQEGCPKFTERSRVLVPGGAANAARSLKHWNTKVIHFHDHRCGPVKTRFMVDNQCLFRHDDDSVKNDLVVVRNEAMHALKSRKVDVVLISDYDKGLLTPEFIQQVVSYCNNTSTIYGSRIPVVADAKRDSNIYRGAIIKGNKAYSERESRMRIMWPHINVVTDGANNPMVDMSVDPTQRLPVSCISHVGAGDCFAAHLALALAYRFSLEDAAAIAHSAGRVYVQYPHNRPPHPHEIRVDLCGSIKGPQI